MVRNTRQRAIIREVLEKADRPLGAQEVLTEAQEQMEGLGIATVYRTIKGLVEEARLVPVELPGEPPRYELGGKDHHHHFHCKDCGKMYELEGCVENLRKLIPKGFRITGHEVLLYGACAHCSAL